jgi:hypothetical protein
VLEQHGKNFPRTASQVEWRAGSIDDAALTIEPESAELELIGVIGWLSLFCRHSNFSHQTVESVGEYDTVRGGGSSN